MAGFTTFHNPDLEAEISHGMLAHRAEPQTSEIGGAALYAVESGEIATENKADLYIRTTTARLGEMGILNTASEGIQYFADMLGTEPADSDQAETNESRVKRILSALAGCASHKEKEIRKDPDQQTEEEKIEHEARAARNQELDTISNEGIDQYFYLRAGLPASSMQQEIESYFKRLKEAELAVFQNQALFRISNPARDEAHRQLIDKWIKQSGDRAYFIQVVSYRMMKLLPAS